MPSASAMNGKLIADPPAGGATALRKGLARSNGNCHAIHMRRPPGSPSGTRFTLLPRILPTASNVSGTVSSPIAPTRCTVLGSVNVLAMVGYPLRERRDWRVQKYHCAQQRYRQAIE